MIVAALTFLVGLTVPLTVYWWLIVRPETAAQADLRRRLGHVTTTVRPSASMLVRSEAPLSRIAWLDRALRMAERSIVPLQQLIVRAGYRFTAGTLLLACACIAALGALLASALVQVFWVTLLAVAFGAYLPFGVLRWRAARRLIRFEETFPEAIDLIGRALRAGHAFTTGLSMVGDEAPEPVAGEFRRLYEEQNFGRPLPDAMRAFAERLPLLDARFFATAVLTQRESGGNLAEVLDNLSSVIRDRFKVKRQIRVVTAHARMTGWVLIAEPPLLALAMTIMAPGHLTQLTTDPLGQLLIAGAVVLQVSGTLLIRRLVKIEY